MSLSVNAQGQIRSRETDQAVLLLVTISPDGFDPVYLVNNTVDITSRGQVYTALPLTVKVTPDDGETLQRVTLTLDNISLELIDWVRTLTYPIPVVLETIFSGNPDVVEQSISDLIIKQIEYNVQSITATLFADDDFNQKLPSDTYNPLEFPGLF
jgi:hypothetical protein